MQSQQTERRGKESWEMFWEKIERGKEWPTDRGRGNADKVKYRRKRGAQGCRGRWGVAWYKNLLFSTPTRTNKSINSLKDKELITPHAAWLLIPPPSVRVSACVDVWVLRFTPRCCTKKTKLLLMLKSNVAAAVYRRGLGFFSSQVKGLFLPIFDRSNQSYIIPKQYFWNVDRTQKFHVRFDCCYATTCFLL